MTGLVERLDSWLYPNYERNWDDYLFRERVLEHIGSESVVLDLGAGAGIVEHMNFRGLASKVCGVDLDTRVVSNGMLDEGRVSDAGEIPYADESFDIVFSDNVVEHLSDPQSVLQEVYRVLKPGGVFLFKTPNKYHYMPLIAQSTPHVFHQAVNRLRGRAEADTFPTLYRMNTRNRVRELASAVGLTVERIELIEGRPEYMRIAWPLYLLGWLYERLVNSATCLARFRILMLAELRKPTPVDSIVSLSPSTSP